MADQANMSMIDKQNVWSQLLECNTPELVKASTSLKSKLIRASDAIVLENVVCKILNPSEDISDSCGKSLEMLMQKLPKTFAYFRRLCEISYQRCVNKDIDDFLGRSLPELIEIIHTEPTLTHLFDPRTMCSVYFPAPKTNICLPPFRLLELFFAAIHLLFQPRSSVISAADAALRHTIDENILVFYCSLATSKISSLATRIRPVLLEYLQNKITREDINKTSSQLLTVIKCLYEGKHPLFLRLIKSSSRDFDVLEFSKAECLHDYFTSTKQVQRFASICTTEHSSQQSDKENENQVGRKNNRPGALPLHPLPSSQVVQSSSNCMLSSARDNPYTSAVT